MKIYIHYNNRYNALTVPHYSWVGEHCAHGETEILELNTPKNSLFLCNRNALVRNLEQNSHSYQDEYDKKLIIILIVIRTIICMDEKPNKNNMDSHSYKVVHDKNL